MVLRIRGWSVAYMRLYHAFFSGGYPLNTAHRMLESKA